MFAPLHGLQMQVGYFLAPTCKKDKFNIIIYIRVWGTQLLTNVHEMFYLGHTHVVLAYGLFRYITNHT
jgi:hypothetical protein